MVQYIKNIEEAKSKWIEIIPQFLIDSKTYFDYNMYVSSLLNRALQINRGYLALKNDDNYLCAITLLRLQIDNCARFYAITL